MYESYCQISFVFGVYFVWFPLDGGANSWSRFWCAACNSVIIIIIIINKVVIKVTLNKVIAGALYIVICG